MIRGGTRWPRRKDWPYVCSECGRVVGVHPTYVTPVCPVHGDVIARNMDHYLPEKADPPATSQQAR